MRPLLAAVAAIVAALVELSVAPFLQVGAAQPDIVLILAVVWTMVVGFDEGLIFAFVGGVMIDVLASRPLGATAFILVLCSGAAALARRFLAWARLASPIVMVFGLAIVAPLLFLGLETILRTPIAVRNPLEPVLPRATYDAILTAIVAPLAMLVDRRFRDPDRVEW